MLQLMCAVHTSCNQTVQSPSVVTTATALFSSTLDVVLDFLPCMRQLIIVTFVNSDSLCK